MKDLNVKPSRVPDLCSGLYRDSCRPVIMYFIYYYMIFFSSAFCRLIVESFNYSI